MSSRFNRREMLRNTALAGAGILASRGATGAEPKSPNEKLNLAFVGASASSSSATRA